MKFYYAIKENEIIKFAGKLMDLEDIVLSEVTPAQKGKCHVFFLICSSYL